MQRREFLVSAALVPGVAAVSGATAAGLGSAAVPAVPPTLANVVTHDVSAYAAEPLVAAAGALGTQVELIGGFRVVRAFDVFHGALPFVLEGEGERFQLDVLRRTDDGASGVHTTDHFAFFAHGPGVPTHERGARALGLALERQLQSGTALPMLASFEERAEMGRTELHVDFVSATV